MVKYSETLRLITESDATILFGGKNIRHDVPHVSKVVRHMVFVVCSRGVVGGGGGGASYGLHGGGGG